MAIDLTKMSVEELKALAYDISIEMGKNRQSLQIVEAEIVKRNQPVEAINASECEAKKGEEVKDEAEFKPCTEK